MLHEDPHLPLVSGTILRGWFRRKGDIGRSEGSLATAGKEAIMAREGKGRGKGKWGERRSRPGERVFGKKKEKKSFGEIFSKFGCTKFDESSSALEKCRLYTRQGFYKHKVFPQHLDLKL